MNFFSVSLLVSYKQDFQCLFGEILEKQLILKNIITSEEWSQIKDKVHYKFEKDHYYTEFKQQETLTQRVDLARNMEEYAKLLF